MCHCLDCQKLSGAAWRASIQVDAHDFAITEGEPKLYIKVADSGARRAQAFCGTCGSSLYAADAESPDHYNLRLGSVDQRAELAPQWQVWRDSALPWASDITALPDFPRGR